MIYLMAAIGIAVLVCILLYSKFATTPDTSSIKNLDFTDQSRPAPKPRVDPMVRKAQEQKARELLKSMEVKRQASMTPSDASASKALNDLMKQYVGGSYMNNPNPYGNITMADKMRLLEDYDRERDNFPDMSEDEIEQRIVSLEEAIMDIEDSYASVQADAEVTGDRTEIDALDEKYGDLEEELAKYKEQLENYGKRQDETAQLMQNIIKEIGLDDSASPFGPDLDGYF